MVVVEVGEEFEEKSWVPIQERVLEACQSHAYYTIPNFF